ncbi:MAG: carbon-nitrogen hydrolase family protein [Planctomycetota bacterium]
MSFEPFIASAIQMVSVSDVRENLAAAEKAIEEAAEQDARLVVLPENFAFVGCAETDKIKIREVDGDGPIQQFLSETASRFGVWLVAGSIPLATTSTSHILNSCLVYDDHGKRIARYDKIHLFGFESGSEKYRESDTIEPGAGPPLAFDSPFGRIGLSICYDVRFPELYRSYGPVDIILVPSAFTETTGRAHWEVLLRARAIENQAYVIAAAQGGQHPNGRSTYGHSMIIDPWGEVLGVRPEGHGVVQAQIDSQIIAQVRASLPALAHRRL